MTFIFPFICIPIPRVKVSWTEECQNGRDNPSFYGKVEGIRVTVRRCRNEIGMEILKNEAPQ